MLLRVQSKRAVTTIVCVCMAVSTALVLPSRDARATQPGDAQRFDTWTGYAIGRYPVAAAAGDFDSDGAPDVAWARNDFFENQMAVSLNHGDGTLKEAVSFPAVASSKDIEAGDLDGDSDLDLVVIAEGITLTNNQVDLYFNDGAGDFTHSTITGGEGPNRVVLAQLNEDDDLDIALVNSAWEAPAVSVLLNNGNGSFGAAVNYDAGGHSTGIAAADLDEDGDADLAASRYDPDTQLTNITPLRNNGSGAFAPAAPIVLDVAYSGGGSPILAAANLNADDDPDLIMAGGGTNEHFVLINGAGLAFTSTSYTGGYGSTDLATPDLDDDGDQDIVSATMGNSATGDLTVFRNSGTGTFITDDASILSGHQPHGIAIADFNLDSRPDLAAANRGSSTGAIHPQEEGGEFAGPDQFGVAMSPFDVATADFDGDSDIDVASSLADNFGNGDAIQILSNDGAGGLIPSQSLPPGGDRPKSVYVSDLDGNGSSDLVWLLDDPSAWDSFMYALNNGDGTFGTPVQEAITSCGADEVTTADSDNDGDQDVLVANNNSDCAARGDVSVSPNNGDGTFGDDSLVPVAGTADMAVGTSLNGDRFIDLAVTHPDACCTPGDVSVLLGGPDGFSDPQTFSTGDSHRDLEVADVDTDGDNDLVTADRGDSVSVLLNDGSGVMDTIDTYQGEEISNLLNQMSIDVGDINGDGNLDIAAANFSGNDLGVHFGSGDGTFEEQQVRYGMATAMRDVGLADLNNDGSLDVVGATGVTISSGARSSSLRTRSAGSQQQRFSAAAVSGASALTVLISSAPGRRNVCTITGTSGPDALVGTIGRDVICGGRGSDEITGFGGNDVIKAGRGNDLIAPGLGRDRIVAGRGQDELTYEASSEGVVVDLTAGSASGEGKDLMSGIEVLRGSPRADEVTGSSGAETLLGGRGADVLRGRGGDDLLSGGGGDDVINGANGHDTADGGSGDNICRRVEVSQNC